jgi:hypothetical protein
MFNAGHSVRKKAQLAKSEASGYKAGRMAVLWGAIQVLISPMKDLQGGRLYDTNMRAREIWNKKRYALNAEEYRKRGRRGQCD